MLKKLTILITLLFICPVTSIAVVKAEISDSSLIAVSNHELTFVGKEGVTQLSRTITIVGLAESGVQVHIVPVDLYDNSSGNTISIRRTLPPLPLDIPRGEAREVELILETSGAAAGTYQGTVLLAAKTNTNITITRIEVSANIKGEILSITFSQMITIAVLLVLIGLAIALKILFDKELVVVLLTFIALYIWFTSIVASSFKLEPINILNTILITPFTAYVLAYVKAKRDEKVAKVGAATKIQNDAIEADIEMLRHVIGETQTHFASFEPKFPGIAEISRGPKILYNPQGMLSRDIWNKYRKQGSLSDLPTLHLEKYYDFIELYNRYYSCAIMLTKDATSRDFKKLEKKPFFRKFEEFRKKYAELQTVLFVYMSYYLGLFGNTRLSPLKIEYPRVTTALLKQLVKYEILEPDKLSLKKEFDTRLENEADQKKFEDYWRSPEGEKWKKDTEKIFKYDEERQKQEPQQTYKKEFKKWIFIQKINKWGLRAVDMEEILKVIYDKENQRKFYHHAGIDFRETYKELLECVKDLEPLPPKCIRKEKTSALLEEHKLLRELFEDIKKLKELEKNDALEPEEFKEVKNRIIESVRSLTKEIKI